MNVRSYLQIAYLNENTDPVVIKSFDRISFHCRVCSSPHIYIILFPKTKEELTPVTVGFNNFAIDESTSIDYFNHRILNE
jgi:hypothetical protein